MIRTDRSTQIKTSDFEAFISDVAAGIWNQLIQDPAFNSLKMNDFPNIFDAVARTLHRYREPKRLKTGAGRRGERL